MISNLFTILLKGKNLELAWSEFENYVKNQSKIAGELSEKCIQDLFNAFMGEKQIDRAFDVLNLAVSLQLPILRDLIKNCESNPNIDSNKKLHLSSSIYSKFNSDLINYKS